jgi:acyl-CoA thioester hydrolase
MNNTSAVDLTRHNSFPYWTRITIRFGDMDRMQHINNMAIGDYFETARVEFRERIHPPLDISEGVGIVIRRICIDFVGQAHYPGEVEVGTRILRIGNSSYTLGQGVFQEGHCFATTETVSDYADSRAGKSLSLPPVLREALGKYMGVAPPAGG